MGALLRKLQALEFQARIFVSFGIVLVVSWLSWPGATGEATPVLLGSRLGLDPRLSLRLGYGLVALLLAGATLLRMWAGSVLSSARMMAFRVRDDALMESGPYRLVRHPIYLSDFVAFCAFALCLRPLGAILPLLLYAHYRVLIGYEEGVLRRQYGEAYARYAAATPRFLPRPGGRRRLGLALAEFRLTGDGVRHNALYVLFLPGFLVSAWTLALWPALVVGLPAVLDWAIVHTILGVRRGPAPDRRGAPVPKIAPPVPSPVWSAVPGDGRPADFRARVAGSGRRSKVLRDILYAQCWEDPEIDRVAFAIGPDDVVFTITSGGCNALAFLADDPRRVIALDLNPHQNRVLELKIAAFRALEYQELLQFLGAAPSARRLELYGAVRRRLGGESRSYWDDRPGKLRRGIIHAGRYESYMRLVRRSFDALLDGRYLAEGLLAARNPTERAAFYHDCWDGRRWRCFTRVLLSRTVQSLLFDRAFYAQLGESFSFGDHFRERVRHAVVDLSLRENPYLCYILFGGFPCHASLPTYLRPENFGAIRSRLDRVAILPGACEEFFPTLPAGAVSRFNFTNIFEWMMPASYEALLAETVRIARPGAVLTYRNLLVPRSRPASLAGTLLPQRELARRLHERDRSFIYRSYVVERVAKP